MKRNKYLKYSYGFKEYLFNFGPYKGRSIRAVKKEKGDSYLEYVLSLATDEKEKIALRLLIDGVLLQTKGKP